MILLYLIKKNLLYPYDHEIRDYISNYLVINKFENNKKSTFETFYFQSLRTPVGVEPIIFPNYQEKISVTCLVIILYYQIDLVF